MKKVAVYLMMAITLLFSLGNITKAAEKKFQSLDNIHDVGTEIYVQHDENNGNLYDLKKGENGSTVVYKEIYPTFTPATSWMKDGSFFTDSSYDWVKKCSATAKNDYIPVKAGETYFISAYGVGGAQLSNGTYVWQTPVLITDDKGNKVEVFFSDEMSRLKGGKEFTIPANGTRLYITMYNNQNFRLQKKMTLTDAEFNKISVDKDALLEDIDKNYAEYKKNQTVYKKTDKAYITFVNDDTRSGVDKIADLFISKGVPICMATCAEALIENSSELKETRLQSIRRIVAAGGEVLTHNATTITADNMDNYELMYASFAKSKMLLKSYGFDVNGIILAGGSGLVYNNSTVGKWANYYYSYSDLYGEQYDKKELVLDSVYYHWRGGVLNYQNNVDKIFSDIDNAIANKSWMVIYFHDYGEITEENLAKVLDYVKSKSKDEVEIVTYKQFYEKQAVKESEVLSNHTYYVSATGTSAIGDDINHPMSYETAKKKTFTSGDTILFKRGDIFYGGFSANIMKIDNDVTTISAYGTGDMPVFCGYKIIDSADVWEKYSDGIWKVNLKDTNNFSGVQPTDYNSNQIGFVVDDNNNKIGKLRANTEWLEYENEFTSDGTNFYIRTPNNPYETFGTLRLATKTNMISIKSNMKICNINVRGTGAHGMLGSGSDIDNVEISNCVIEDIGGAYLKNTIRYGNGIEFYETNVSNLVIKNNIIRNVYDVAFTIQGNAGSGKNVKVIQNVFVGNTQDSEIWESSAATGVMNYHFANNISISQGRGWGYASRNDKYPAGHILFWGYTVNDKEKNTDITFISNAVYNPRQLYYIENTNGTDLFFRDYDCIKSDYNAYYLADDSTLFRNTYKLSTKDEFINTYNKDKNSTFNTLNTATFSKLESVAFSSRNIDEIRKQATINNSGFKYSTTKATTTKNGKIVKSCKICSEVFSEDVIYRISTVELAKTNFVYSGKANKPSVTVKDTKGNIISSKYYTVEYSNVTNVGTGTVKITFKDKYEAVVTRNIKIVPRQTSITSIKNVAEGVSISWTKISEANKYQVFRRKVTSKWVTGWTWLKDTTSTSFIDTKAEHGCTYEYVIKPKYNEYAGNISATAKIKRINAPKITGLISVTNGIKISWQSISGTTKYQVFRKTIGNGWETGWTWLKDTTNTNFTDSTAKKGVTYVYAVKSISAGTNGALTISNKIKA